MNDHVRVAERKLDNVATVALFAVSLILYVSTMAPTVAEMYDDTLEFPLVVQRLAIAHPTGYPLYTLVGKLFSFLPVGDVAYRLHLFSAVCAALAVALLYQAARRFGLCAIGALAASMALAVSPVFWSQAVVAEVYALNALFVVALLALAAAWGEPQARRFAALAMFSFTFGLSLTHHRTILLLFPALAFYLLLARLRRVDSAGKDTAAPLPRWWLLWLLVLFAAPLLLYAYIPLRGTVTSSLDGTYQNTLQGFLTWVLGGQYTIFLSSNPFNQAALGVADYVALFIQQFGMAGVVLAMIGAAALALRRRRVFGLLAAGWLTVVVFVHLYRVSDAPVFLLPAFILVALAAGAGVDVVAGVASDEAAVWRQRLQAPRLLLATTLAVLAPALIFTSNLHRSDRSADWAVHNYAIDVLSQPLEPGAAVVGILGEVTLLRYMQETQAMRPDIETVAADTDVLRWAAVNRLTAAGQSVYLTRPLAGLEATFALRAVGPLIHVAMPDNAASVALVGASTVKAVFGEQIELVNYRLTGLASDMTAQSYPQDERLGAVESGGRLRLAVTWQATRPSPGDYQVTVRLKTPTGRLLWQSDGRPVHGSYPTGSWRSGEKVSDVYDLYVPVGTPPGLCDVEIGIYDGGSLQLLPVAGRMELLAIGPVSVVRPANSIRLSSMSLTSPAQLAALTIPRGRFDNSLQRIGVTHVVRGNLQNEFTLYGFGMVDAAPVPGQSIDVTLLWQAARAPSGDRVVFVQVTDKTGRVWASHESQPAEGAYATHEWQRDEIVRDVHTLLLPGDMPDGTYHLEAGMYDPSGSPLTVLRLTRRSLDHVALATVEVRGRPRSQQIPTGIQHMLNARLGRVATLVGFDSWIGGVALVSDSQLVARQGDSIQLRLIWQAMEPTQTSYTIFVHLLGPDGVVVAQDDAVPGRGAWPTTSWLRGEVLQDAFTLAVPGNAASGDYQIELGLYDALTGNRLPVWDGSGASVGDSLIVTKVRVERTP